jgi:hypothetical protein
MAQRRFRPGDYLVAFFAALITSTLGTLQHQTRLSDNLPIGLFLSISLVFMGAALVRDRSRTKGPGFFFALSVAALVFLTGQNLTNDILIPGNDLGLYWSYGSIATATLVALWPKLKS